MDKPERHSMQHRSPGNNYTHPGIYHITITISDRKAQSLGRVTGDLQYPDGHPDAPKVELSVIGKMVEYELLHSISYHYPFIEVQDYHARTHALYSQCQKQHHQQKRSHDTSWPDYRWL